MTQPAKKRTKTALTELPGDVHPGIRLNFHQLAARIDALSQQFNKTPGYKITGTGGSSGGGGSSGAGRRYFADGTSLQLAVNVFSIKDTAVTPGEYGGPAAIPIFTVNSKGQLVAASETPFSAGTGVESRYEIFEDEEIEVTQGRNMLLLGSLLNNGAVLNNGVMAYVRFA